MEAASVASGAGVHVFSQESHCVHWGKPEKREVSWDRGCTHATVARAADFGTPRDWGEMRQERLLRLGGLAREVRERIFPHLRQTREVPDEGREPLAKGR